MKTNTMTNDDLKHWRTYLCGGEFKITSLMHDAPRLVPGVVDNPETVVAYLEAHLPDSIRYSPDTENLLLISLTARKHPIGWQVISNGTLDTLLVHPREVFRPALIVNAAAIILAHNHPSGDPSPSEADIKVTRDLIRAGQLLKVDLLDHVILGSANPKHAKGYCSLRELGYFYS